MIAPHGWVAKPTGVGPGGVQLLEVRHQDWPADALPGQLVLAGGWPGDTSPGWRRVAEMIDRTQATKGTSVPALPSTLLLSQEQAWSSPTRLAMARSAQTGESFETAVLHVTDETAEGQLLREAYYGSRASVAKQERKENLAWVAIENAAQELRRRNPKLTREAAIARAVEIDPKLARAYNASIRGE